MPCTCLAWQGRDGLSLRKQYPDPRLGNLTLSDVISSLAEVIKSLPENPIIIGHSMGGLAVQLLLQRDLAATGVAINYHHRWGF